VPTPIRVRCPLHPLLFRLFPTHSPPRAFPPRTPPSQAMPIPPPPYRTTTAIRSCPNPPPASRPLGRPARHSSTDCAGRPARAPGHPGLGSERRRAGPRQPEAPHSQAMRPARAARTHVCTRARTPCMCSQTHTPARAPADRTCARAQPLARRATSQTCTSARPARAHQHKHRRAHCHTRTNRPTFASAHRSRIPAADSPAARPAAARWWTRIGRTRTDPTPHYHPRLIHSTNFNPTGPFSTGHHVSYPPPSEPPHHPQEAPPAGW
jgi:hypothetical protein